jgi:hypothetical protein
MLARISKIINAATCRTQRHVSVPEYRCSESRQDVRDPNRGKVAGQRIGHATNENNNWFCSFVAFVIRCPIGFLRQVPLGVRLTVHALTEPPV